MYNVVQYAEVSICSLQLSRKLVFNPRLSFCWTVIFLLLSTYCFEFHIVTSFDLMAYQSASSYMYLHITLALTNRNIRSRSCTCTHSSAIYQPIIKPYTIMVVVTADTEIYIYSSPSMLQPLIIRPLDLVQGGNFHC